MKITLPAINMRITLFLSLLLLIGDATNTLVEARDAPPLCTGQNLLDEMKISNRRQYDKIKAVGKNILNGQALLWRIEGGDTKPSYLFGTMHSTDPRIASMQGQAAKHFNQSDRLIVEVSDIDPKKAAQLMTSKPRLFFLGKGTSLKKLLPPDDYQNLMSIAKPLGLPATYVNMLKPWFVTLSFLQLPACEAARLAAGLNVLDAGIVKAARARGNKVYSLETMNEQFSAMAAIPLKDQVTMLQDGLHSHRQVTDIYETTLQLYLKRQLGATIPLTVALGRDADKTLKAWKSFERHLLILRNYKMAERSLKYINQGNSFIAVGALHLPGKEGVVELLKQRGLKLTPIE